MLRIREKINRLRFSRMLQTTDRKNSNCSRFVRNVEQLKAVIEGPVLEHVRRGNRERLRIVVLGCSFGPEPVSIASLLLWKRPDVDFYIDGYDIDEDCLAVARRGAYKERHVFNEHGIDEEFVDRTFTRDGESYVVNPHILERISYSYGDVTDESLVENVGSADIVVAQHFLYHLPRDEQTTAFRRIVELLPPHGVLLADGADLDLRQKEARRLGLKPLDYRIREIHEDSRRTPWAQAWPYTYYGLEPFDESGDWKMRYATIFIRS